MVDCPDRPCPVCRGPMPEGRKSACSGRCRARLSRQRKAQAREERDHQLQRLVEVLAKEVGIRPEDLA